MMDAIWQHLQHNHYVVGVVDSNAEGVQVFKKVAPRSAKGKYVVIQKISGRGYNHLQGHNGLNSGLWQFSCFGDLDSEADDISEAVRLAINGYQGNMGEPGAQVNVRTIRFETDTDISVTGPTSGSQKSKFGIALDFVIMHREQTAVAEI